MPTSHLGKYKDLPRTDAQSLKIARVSCVVERELVEKASVMTIY